MLNWIRKNNKKLLAVFGVFLMIAFVADFGVRGRRQGRADNSVIGHIGSEEVRNIDYERAMMEWQMLNSRELRVQIPMGQRPNGQPIVEDFTLVERLLAQKLIFAYGPQAALFAAKEISRQMDPATYFLLLTEARRMGVAPSRDLVQQILTDLSQRPSENAILRERAIINWLTVMEAFDRVNAAVKVSPAMGTHAVASEEQQVAVNLVSFKAEDFKAQVGQPSEQDLAEFFNKYRETDPETDEFGFGYRYPNRVKIEYVMVPRDKLKDTITMEDIYEFYKKNQQLFPATQPTEPAAVEPAGPPTTQQASTGPATRATASTRPTTRPLNEVQDLIRERLANDLAVNMAKSIEQVFKADWPQYRQAVREAGSTTQPVSVTSTLGVPYNSYAYLLRLRARVLNHSSARGVAPEIWPRDESLARETPFMTRRELEKLDGIGKAMGGAIGSMPMPFPNLAVDLAAPFMTEQQKRQVMQREAPMFDLYQPSPPLRDEKGNYYFFRITAVDPAHPAPNLAAVAEKVKVDWITARAYDKAKLAAGNLLEAAKKEGLLAAAKAADKPVISTKAFYNDPQSEIDEYKLPPQVNARFKEGAFNLLVERLRTGQAEPAGLIELPQVATVNVAQLTEARPAEKHDVFSQYVVRVQRQLEARRMGEMMVKWFEHDAVAQRLKFQWNNPRGNGRAAS